MMRAAAALNTIGVNTHIDFRQYGYQNLATVEASINYLGIHNLRDCAQTTDDYALWLHVARATHSKFDAYMPEGSASWMQEALKFIPQLAAEHVLNFIEGGNEEDAPYAVNLGNTLAQAALFQQQVYTLGHQLGLRVINMSFGAGWTWTNNWIGDYGKVGDLSPYADYGNSHTYPLVEQHTDDTITRINGLAKMADSVDPAITTEIGWNESMGYGQDNIAKYSVQAVLDGIKSGNPKTYFYGLFNDGSGLFGLMNQDGTPKPAGVAIHNLTTILADDAPTRATFITAPLTYTLTNTLAHDSRVIMEKSDGTYWLALWNEHDAAHVAHLTIPDAHMTKTFDPLVSALTTSTHVGGVLNVTITDHPQIIEVMM